MRVLFIYSDVNVKGGAKSYHFGLGILSAVLREKGHDTRLYYMFDKFDTSPLVEIIEDFKPSLIAATSDSSQFRYIQKIFKDVMPFGIFTICGGPHVSLNPRALEETEGLRAICVGEGEGAILELVDSIENGKDLREIRNLCIKTDGDIIRNPMRPFIQDLDSLPFCDREIFDYQSVIASDYDRAVFMLSRGCPYKCTYCSNHALRELQQGPYVRFRSVESSIEEIKSVLSRYRARSIFLADDVFTLNRDFVKEFCERYKKEIGIPFEVTTRVETASEDMFGWLKEAGCTRVAMGIESGNEWLRTNILSRRMTNEQLIKAFRLAREAGLKTKSYNIVGFPGETEEMFEDTVRLNAEINPDSHVCYIFNPYPGTKLHGYSLEKGYFSDTPVEEFVSRTDTPLNLPTFSREKILKAYRNFSYRVYKKISIRKAIVYKIYYSRFGEKLIRILDPVKKWVRRIAMDR
ncbi:MAG: radical SAM protein [Nitrospirota bacterium]